MQTLNLSERISFFKQELEIMQDEVKKNEGEIRNTYIDICNSLSDVIYNYKKIREYSPSECSPLI